MKKVERKSVREVVIHPQDNCYYVLVTRYYPRFLRLNGVKLKQSPFATWDRELAPSRELLKAYKSRKIDWKGYVKRFRKEKSLSLIKERMAVHWKNADGKRVILVCIEEDSAFPFCHTWLLMEMLEDE